MRLMTRQSFNLHSTMSLLQLLQHQSEQGLYTEFTFHNVSITTRCVSLECLMTTIIYIPQCLYYNRAVKILRTVGWIFTFHNVSITTMLARRWCSMMQTFTFHNVSITTQEWGNHVRKLQNLHSTMSLLQQLPERREDMLKIIFTFHNVSITTSAYFIESFKQINLHSTMSLLQRRISCSR